MYTERHIDKSGLTLNAIRRLYRRNARKALYRLIEKIHPSEMAWVFRYLTPKERQDIYKYIQRMDGLGEFLNEVDHVIIPEIYRGVPAVDVASSLKSIPAETIVELLESLPEDLASDVRNFLTTEDREEVEEVLQYVDDSAGRIMSHEFMVFKDSLSVSEAIAQFQDLGEDTEMPFYIYVINEQNQMVGVLSLRQLLLNAAEKILKDLMEDKFVFVYPETDQEDVANMVSQYNYLALPVLNESMEIVGIVTVDDVIDIIREEATEDMLKMAGAGEDEDILLKSTFQNVKTRFPWLLASWIGGVCALWIIGSFESLLQQTIFLAAFIPVIIGMGGNVGTQTSTIIVRGIATGHVNIDEVTSVIWKEVRVGTLLGTIYGILLGGLAYLQFPYYEAPIILGAVVGFSIMLSMVIACIVASFLPIFLFKLDFDPAISTGPFVTTSIDILGVLSYFIIANSFLPGL